MGLDNRFMGHFKSRPEVEISLAYFRKYFNLNDWMLQHCSPVKEDNPYDVIVTKDNLETLLKEIEQIAEALNKFNYNQISYYEDNGYFPIRYGTDHVCGGMSFLAYSRIS